MPQVTLIGYRGSGKSTVAACLAARLACGWQDADAVLEDRLGCTIADLVKNRGEPAFRAAEAELLDELLGAATGVLATGGGVVLRAENRERLRARGRPVVWLRVSVATARSRLAGDPNTAARRPALSGTDPLAEVAAAIADREPWYRECADVVVDSDDRDPDAIAADILGRLVRLRPGESSA
jgi:shikimate kinase